MKALVYAADIFYGDAVGNHCLSIANFYKSLGLDVCISASNYSFGISDFTPRLLMDNYDIIYFSYSIFDPMLPLFSQLDHEKKILYYHGVTPSHLLEKYDPVCASICRKSQSQYFLFKDFGKIIANSSLSAKVLMDYTSKNIIVMPPVMELCSDVNRPKVVSLRNEGIIKILVLGRVAPHKCIEDALLIVSNLILNGFLVKLDIIGSLGPDIYIEFLQNEITRLNLKSFVELHGFINDVSKIDYINCADFLLVTSLHEGFCVPVYEANLINLPVISRAGIIPIENLIDKSLEFTDIKDVVQLIRKFYSTKEMYRINNYEIYINKYQKIFELSNTRRAFLF